VIVGSTEGETILAMNHGVPALADVRVRQAIAHAINRQEIIDGAMFGYGTPSARISRRTIPTTST
jgi:peptide/nickel transport system substrate-binding protein